MLICRIWDTQNKLLSFQFPLKLTLLSSADAPADSLTAVFAVTGEIPALHTIEAEHNGECIFSGYVDSQTRQVTSKGDLLTIAARSKACLLLDNEALPQTYSMVSMPILMERHFRPLGFDRFAGSDKAFDDELTVTKGMSEWAVLTSFCRKFLHTSPFVRHDGVIDVSGDREEICCLSTRECLSVKHTLKRCQPLSDIIVRAARSDGYVMPFHSPLAETLHIRRRRYLNAADSAALSAASAQELLDRADNQYEQLELELAGGMFAPVGSALSIDTDDKPYLLRERCYTLSEHGEVTKLYAEVKYH